MENDQLRCRTSQWEPPQRTANGAAPAAPEPPACKHMVDVPAVPAAELHLAVKKSSKLPLVCILKRVWQTCLREGAGGACKPVSPSQTTITSYRSIKSSSAVSTLGSAYACPSGDSRLSSANVCSSSSSLIHMPHRQHVASTPAGFLHTSGHHNKKPGRSCGTQKAPCPVIAPAAPDQERLAYPGGALVRVAEGRPGEQHRRRRCLNRPAAAVIHWHQCEM